MMDRKNLLSKRILGFSTYQIVFLVVLIAALFLFSDSSIQKRYRYEKQIQELKEQIEFYRHQSEIDKQRLHELQSNKENLEKFARENYLMKKENEDVFIIE